jgi:orotate phosphoribosyltransferase
MDRVLAQAMIDLDVPRFGSSEKNRSDSRSCRFEPRNLLSSPEILQHVGQRLGQVAKTSCSGSALVGMATSGIAWAALASLHSGLPMLYVRKSAERLVSNKLLEGIPPADGKLILVDDLLFAGESKREALKILHGLGYTVTDILVVIDRELQKVADGPRIQEEYGLRLHSLITMSEIIDHLRKQGAVSEKQLMDLIADYRSAERWDMPDFALPAVSPRRS